jgi:hypothetical protein
MVAGWFEWAGYTMANVILHFLDMIRPWVIDHEIPVVATTHVLHFSVEFGAVFDEANAVRYVD